MRAPPITRLGTPDPPAEVVRRMLAKPRPRLTNIAAALEFGAAELERGHNPRRSGLLITDGVATVGGDPVPLARRFPRLFVLLTEGTGCRTGGAAAAASPTPGAATSSRSGYPELPRRLLDVANRVLR